MVKQHVIRSIVFALLLLLGSGLQLRAAPTAPPPLAESLRTIPPLTFCGEPVPLDAHEVRERLEKELLISLWDRDQAMLWLKRSTRYLPAISAALMRAGLPDDLKYIALAESALRPHVGSPKGAIGFWQFLPATGRRYGLTIDAAIDERRSLAASTRAAVAYFTELHDRFGSWSLATAAFNMGEEGLRAEILAQGTDNYYRLYLPLETQRYLFRILSAKLILTRPQDYGFQLRATDYYPPLRYETAELTSPDETSLRLVAEAADTDFKRIKDLNPQLRGHYLAAGEHRLNVPEGTATELQQRFERLHSEWRTQRSQRIYVVQPGDNLSTIAAKFDVPLVALLIWNRIDMNQPIYPGDRLVIESRGGHAERDAASNDQ